MSGKILAQQPVNFVRRASFPWTGLAQPSLAYLMGQNFDAKNPDVSGVPVVRATGSHEVAPARFAVTVKQFQAIQDDFLRA